MGLKNKEINKLFDAVELYFDSWCLPSLISAFMVCDDAIEGEIAALKAELTDANRRKDIYHGNADHLRNMALERGDELRKANNQIDELKEKLNIERKHGEDLANANGQLATENVDLKSSLTLLENSRTAWRSRAQHAEKAVTDLNKKIHELEEENANLRVTPDDAIRVKSLERANEILRRENGTLWTTLEKRDIDERTCYESLSKAIEFQNKKIEELEAEKARLKEECDVHETTIKKYKENVDLSYGHEFEFGDEVFVPWSDAPYMYVKTGLLYNTRTKRLVYVGKDQHLKWFGEKFSIV